MRFEKKMRFETDKFRVEGSREDVESFVARFKVLEERKTEVQQNE